MKELCCRTSDVASGVRVEEISSRIVGVCFIVLALGALMAYLKQTDLCTYLSAILLGGLLLSVLPGWWADPVAALVMVQALRGETCCDEGASH
ncbi:MAG TPA: hypothetical protein VF290_17525 [Pyrinomonadaceae bacterium]